MELQWLLKDICKYKQEVAMYNSFEQNAVDISVKERDQDWGQRKSTFLDLVVGKSDPGHELPSFVSSSGPREPVRGLELSLAGCLSPLQQAAELI